MAYNPDAIAWLVPTATDTPMDEATLLACNSHLVVPTASTPALCAALAATRSRLDEAALPPRALQLSFSRARKQAGRIVLGADAARCDVVLPPRPGLAGRHCALRFDDDDDARGRLTLEDESERGTQVWFGCESRGDCVGGRWVLHDRHDQSLPQQRIVVDVQGVRMQVVVNELRDEGYAARVDALAQQTTRAPKTEPVPVPVPEPEQGPEPYWWAGLDLAPVMPLFSAVPLFRHILVKTLAEEPVGEVYLWNLARPWEPMIKAGA